MDKNPNLIVEILQIILSLNGAQLKFNGVADEKTSRILANIHYNLNQNEIFITRAEKKRRKKEPPKQRGRNYLQLQPPTVEKIPPVQQLFDDWAKLPQLPQPPQPPQVGNVDYGKNNRQGDADA